MLRNYDEHYVWERELKGTYAHTHVQRGNVTATAARLYPAPLYRWTVMTQRRPRIQQVSQLGNGQSHINSVDYNVCHACQINRHQNAADPAPPVSTPPVTRFIPESGDHR